LDAVPENAVFADRAGFVRGRGYVIEHRVVSGFIREGCRPWVIGVF
jgi:hypothetical protein